MKVTVTKSALLQGLQAVQNVVGVRTTLPVLANVLLNADKDGRLLLTTTDLDLSVCATIDAKVTKPGITTLPARRLSGIIRELPEAEIDIEVDEKDVATLKCGASFFKIVGLSEEEFPPLTKPDGKRAYAVEQGVFKEMLRKTGYAASTDETRFVLNGVLLSFKGGKLVMVATDGRRLALAEHELEFPKEDELDMILPSKAATELMHTLQDEGPLRIHASENKILFEFGSIVLSSKLIDGTYPNFRQVIPANCEERVAVERESLLSALRRVSLVTTEKSNATKLTFAKNNLVVSMNTPDVGEARETLPIKYTGKEITVAFNPEFMMDPLKNLSCDEIYVELTDELSPGVIKCDIPFLYVLMPMRIG
jgi:DNA polymerase III subunit beta